jgi:hypothetical protein
VGRIIRQLKAELFGLIRLLASKQPDKSGVMDTPVPKNATDDKPKKNLLAR